jgi:hypothetical protein
MAAAQPWWLIATSTNNGKPWNVITFEGSKSAAEGETAGIHPTSGVQPGTAIVGGPFATLATLEAWAKAHNQPYTNDPAASSGNPLTGVGDSVKQGANSAANSVGLGGLDAIGAFFSNLGQASTWVRVGQVALGLILIAVGAARITHAPNIISTAVKAAAV